MNRVSAKNLTVLYPLFDRASALRNKEPSTNQNAGWGRVSIDQYPHIVAVDNIDFSVGVGERVALIGKNGSGKTTLLRTIGQIITPNFGNLEITGTVGGIFNLKQGLKPESSGRRNILIRGICMGMSVEEVKEKQEQIEIFSELGAYLDLPISTYSSGMLIRLVFSVVIAFKPDIMLLDEWIGTSDEGFQRKVENYLKTYSASGGTYLLASHSRRLLKKMCDTGVMMKNGKIIARGPIEEVLDRYSNS